jgi:hypothetical protein
MIIFQVENIVVFSISPKGPNAKLFLDGTNAKLVNKLKDNVRTMREYMLFQAHFGEPDITFII